MQEDRVGKSTFSLSGERQTDRQTDRDLSRRQHTQLRTRIWVQAAVKNKLGPAKKATRLHRQKVCEMQQRQSEFTTNVAGPCSASQANAQTHTHTHTRARLARTSYLRQLMKRERYTHANTCMQGSPFFSIFSFLLEMHACQARPWNLRKKHFGQLKLNPDPTCVIQGKEGSLLVKAKQQYGFERRKRWSHALCRPRSS